MDMIRLLEKIIDWSTDKFVGVGMAFALILALSLGMDTNVLTNIISGLLGYMSKTVVNNKGGDV